MEVEEEVEGSEGRAAPKRPMWKGSITIGLINVPVKLLSMVHEKDFAFRFLHKADGQPLKYERVCTKDNKVVEWKDVVRGYEVSKEEFITFTKEELEAAKPESDRRIRLSKFVDFFSIDPVFFERSYILTPNESGEAYQLLRMSLESLGKAGLGRITMRTKEYPALVHVYRGALVLTTLRYASEVADPRKLEDLKGLKEPGKDELELAAKIIKDLSGEFKVSEFKDSYGEKLEELIQKKLKGEKVVIEKPAKEEAKELMTALQETLSQLKKK